MPHVTFIHGICNKPPKDVLLQIWEDALTQGGLNLGAAGVTTSMVYWADVMYATPDSAEGHYERAGEELATEEADEDTSWQEGLPAEEKAFVERLAAKLGYDAESPGDDNFAPPPPGEAELATAERVAFEAIPLPWFVKRRLMKLLLRDVHHYLFNAEHSPRPGEQYRVQDHIRRLFVDQLTADSAANSGGAHVVVSHSMGTVISYDCLKNVLACAKVDHYMTIGCPLGLSEVHDNLKPGYSRHDGFPSEKVGGEWVNVYDRLDIVALDAHIADDYQRRGNEVIEEMRVKNEGDSHHSIWRYLGQRAVCERLARMLGVPLL